MTPKIGRPKAMQPKVVKYSVRFSEETEMKLQRYCSEHGITKGEAIRRGVHLLFGQKNQKK